MDTQITDRSTAARFFKGAAVAGRLHLLDIPDEGPWKIDRLTFRDEDEVRWIVRTGGTNRRIARTVVDLDAALQESAVKAVALNVYIDERLLPDVRARWERAETR